MKFDFILKALCLVSLFFCFSSGAHEEQTDNINSDWVTCISHDKNKPCWEVNTKRMVAVEFTDNAVNFYLGGVWGQTTTCHLNINEFKRGKHCPIPSE